MPDKICGDNFDFLTFKNRELFLSLQTSLLVQNLNDFIIFNFNVIY